MATLNNCVKTRNWEKLKHIQKPKQYSKQALRHKKLIIIPKVVWPLENQESYDFLTKNFSQIFKLGIFYQQLGTKYTFWHWEWGPILAPNEAKKEHCLYMYCCVTNSTN